MGNFKRGGNPNSRNGFKKLNSRGKELTLEEAYDLRRLHNWKFLYKRRAMRKNLEIGLTDQEFLNLVKASCHYCDKSYLEETRLVNGRLVQMLSIDRKNSAIGYIPSNCVPSCKQCNTIKMDYSYEDFVAKVAKIAVHLKLI